MSTPSGGSEDCYQSQMRCNGVTLTMRKVNPPGIMAPVKM